MLLDYEDYYRYVWSEVISEYDVSVKYREENQDFLRLITFSSYQKYITKNVHEHVYAEMLKDFFHCLFLLKPKVADSQDY